MLELFLPLNREYLLFLFCLMIYLFLKMNILTEHHF